jgi:pyruvate dehydrogenase E1 component alpha subunit
MRMWQERDPILRLAQHLVENGMTDAAQLAAIDTKVGAEIKDAVAFAKAAPEPSADDLLSHVYV